MSLETDLVTTLSTLCPRVFPDVADTSTARPYITYQQFGGKADTYTEGAVPDIRNARMQINVWSTTKSEVVSLMLQIEALLVASMRATAESALYSVFDDDDLDLRGCAQDFSIWAGR
jgi:Protein of unknown function (DUF3168)